MTPDEVAFNEALAWMGADVDGPLPALAPLHADDIRWTLRSVDIVDELLAHGSTDQIAPAAVADTLARRELLAIALGVISDQRRALVRQRELQRMERARR